MENTNGGNVSPKSRTVAMLLGIFLGEFGAHNFYLGKTSRAVVQLVLGVIGFFLLILSPLFLLGGVGMTFGILFIDIVLLAVVGIWGFIEWIQIACGKGTDNNGLPVLTW